MKTTYYAFGLKRRSHLVYLYATRDNHGVVHFHQTLAAAERAAGRYGHIEEAKTAAQLHGEVTRP